FRTPTPRHRIFDRTKNRALIKYCALAGSILRWGLSVVSRDLAVAPHIAEFFRARQRDILTSWQQEVQQVHDARRVLRSALIDHIPDLLLQIGATADRLAHGDDPDIHAGVGGQHALTRMDESVDLAEIVAEYCVLRRYILRWWQQESVSPERDTGAAILGEAVDKVLVASIDRYAVARDCTLEALDRVSTAGLEAASLDELLAKLLHVLLDTSEAIDTAAILLRENNDLVLRGSVGLDPGVDHEWRVA